MELTAGAAADICLTAPVVLLLVPEQTGLYPVHPVNDCRSKPVSTCQTYLESVLVQPVHEGSDEEVKGEEAAEEDEDDEVQVHVHIVLVAWLSLYLHNQHQLEPV